MNGVWQRLNRTAPGASLLIASAGLLNAAFYVPSLHWLVFIFLIPLLSVVLYMPTISGKHGFVWGISWYCFHWLGLWYFMIEHGQGLGRIVCCVFLLLYCALTGAGWFGVSSWITKATPSRNGIMIVWVVSTYLFFLWARFCMFIIFGHWFGDPFALPLLPLMQQSAWLYFLPSLGSTGLLACLILFSACLARACIERSGSWAFAASIFFLPFGAGWFMDQKKLDCTVLTSHVAIIPVQVRRGHTGNPHDCAQYLQDCIVERLETVKKGTNCIVVLPESAFPFPLNEHEYALELLQCSSYCDDLWVIVGAHRKEQDKLHNSLFVIHNNKITQHYDKTFLMPFTEYIPTPWNMISFISRFFLSEKVTFVRSISPPHSIRIAGYPFCPLICADFFIGLPQSQISQKKEPLVCILNDSWFSIHAMRRWMLLFARYHALEWSQEIIYVGYEYGVYIDAQGNAQEL